MVDHEDGGKSHRQPRRASGRGRHSAKRLLQNPGGQGREGSFKQGTHRQPTVGAPDQPEQGGNKKKDRGYQVTWRAKVWKNLKKCFKRDSQAKDTPDRSKTREEREEQDSYRRPPTGTSVKPGQGRTERPQEEQSALTEKEPAASRTSPVSKDKKDTCGEKASQKDAGSPATR